LHDHINGVSIWLLDGCFDLLNRLVGNLSHLNSFRFLNRHCLDLILRHFLDFLDVLRHNFFCWRSFSDLCFFNDDSLLDHHRRLINHLFSLDWLGLDLFSNDWLLSLYFGCFSMSRSVLSRLWLVMGILDSQ
jgi:hypothetical protein